MQPDYPDNSDGDALRSVASNGSDMNRSMLIEFPVVFPTELATNQFSAVAADQGFEVQLWKHDDDSDWDVICAVDMVATHAHVTRIQRELTTLAAPYGGICNCWGTFGNGPNNSRQTK